jgi:hypothetical protein
MIKRCFLVFIVGLGGCTAEQAYYSTQHWQRNECRKIRSGDDRSRCEARPQLSFEQYEAERNKTAKAN